MIIPLLSKFKVKIGNILLNMPLSHIDLYDKFKRTDGKGLLSIQALAALNIHLGGNKIISKNDWIECTDWILI